jgi:hypothetical protein
VTHHATITRLLGVDPDRKGVQMLRTRKFQGYCEDCGWIGKQRDNWFTARCDVAVHRAAARQIREGGEPGGGL